MKLNQFPHEKDLHIPVIIKLGLFLFFFPYFFTFLSTINNEKLES